MDILVAAFVVVVKLALAGFVMWGGWLSFSTWLRGDAPQANDAIVEPKPQSFERVASLVLLALLCTTLAGLPL
ncbi:MAG: hypothetical protein JOZ85_07310 [Betaproteobacteria bacterium]|nr:hypothetical protein [Betaproteobacteria bacterium]